MKYEGAIEKTSQLFHSPVQGRGPHSLWVQTGSYYHKHSQVSAAWYFDASNRDWIDTSHYKNMLKTISVDIENRYWTKYRLKSMGFFRGQIEFWCLKLKYFNYGQSWGLFSGNFNQFKPKLLHVWFVLKYWIWMGQISKKIQKIWHCAALLHINLLVTDLVISEYSHINLCKLSAQFIQFRSDFIVQISSQLRFSFASHINQLCLQLFVLQLQVSDLLIAIITSLKVRLVAKATWTINPGLKRDHSSPTQSQEWSNG